MRTMRSKGFTIVELFTVLVLLGILASLMMPRLFRSKMKTYHTGCVQNVHNVGSALEIYATYNQGRYPDTLEVLRDTNPPYMQSLPLCPSDSSTYGYQAGQENRLYTVHCRGIHYRQLDNVQEGYPQFYSGGRLEAFGG